MHLFAPTYYKDFKCIANKCQHNCCIGWEIDVDEETLEKYKTVPEIMKKISFDGTPHFVLGENDRCPFLQNDNLCEIINHHGEQALCQICRDHPRFYSEFDSRTEVGLGLTCEAAAKLILDNDFGLEVITETDEPSIQNEDETEFFEYREEIFSKSPTEFKDLLPEIAVSELKEILKDLERLDTAWDRVLDGLSDHHENLTEINLNTVHATRLFHYFAFRYLHRYDLEFCLLCTAVICCIDGDIYETARMFSSEIEYSDQNIETLIEQVLD